MKKMIITAIAVLLLFPAAVSRAYAQLKVPERPSTSVFQGAQGKQKTEISFDPSSGMVTLKLVVQDAHGYFIPGIHRDNFAVYEDGVLQTDATVEIEHAPVSLGLLLEYGGHQRGFNRDLVREVSRAAHQLLESLGREDSVAVWAYGDTVKQLADFSQAKEKEDTLIQDLMPPDVSETNLYDALTFALNRMKAVTRRRAIVLISTGIDTFSKTSYEATLEVAGRDNTPIYAIGLGHLAAWAVPFQSADNPLSRIDWPDVEHKIQEIARTSGGRFYSPDSTINLSPVYDDIMENLKVRYVITYRSSSGNTNGRHIVRVDLVDPKTGQPLKIVDANGKPVLANAIVNESYTASH
jgi:Ca-activated chloride channel family protein